MTKTPKANLRISFKSPSHEYQARQFAARLWESTRGPDAVFGVQRQRLATPQDPFSKASDLETQQLVEAAQWLVQKGWPNAEDYEAILALLFLSHDSRVALTRLQVICVRALAMKMRSANFSCAFADEVYYNYVKLLQALTSLLSALSHAKGDHLQAAFRAMALLAMKLGMLPACSELLAIVTRKAVHLKMRLEEVEMVVAASSFPLMLVSHMCSQLNEQASKTVVYLLILMPQVMVSCNFMEHSARALTLGLEAFDSPLGGVESSGSDANDKQRREEVLDRLCVMHRCIYYLSTSATVYDVLRVSAGDVAIAAIKTMMSGPCLQYTLAASIVSTLASADGGTLYGMTTPLPVTMEVLPHVIKSWHWVCEQSPPIKLQLYSPRAVRHVCRRMLNVARISVVSEAAAQRVALQGRPQQPQPEHASSPSLPNPLSPKISLNVALSALRCYALMSPHPLVQNLRPGGGRWGTPNTITDNPAAAEYWPEAVSTISAFLDYVKAVPYSDLLKPYVPEMLACLEVAVGDLADGEVVPPPSRSLIAALAAGYVPLLERSLRALARNISHQSQGRGLAPLLGVFGDEARLGALLAYGDPHEVASLLATGAKLLKRLLHSDVEEQVKAVDPLVIDWMNLFLEQVIASSDGEPSVAARSPSCSTGQPDVGVGDVSDSASGKDCGAGVGRCNAEETLHQTSYPSQQAASLIATCLPLWLPPLAALGKLPMVDTMGMSRLLVIPTKCFMWMPALVAAMEIEEGRLQLPGCESSGGSGNIDSKGRKFGWRRFLVRQWDVVGQLGLCLVMMVTGSLKVYGPLYPIMLDTAYQVLRCLMYALPGEVASGLKDGRLPALTAEQLVPTSTGAPQPSDGTTEAHQSDVEYWRALLLQLQQLKTKQFTADESEVQAFWASMPLVTKMGSMLVMANCPAATLTTKGTEASTSVQGSMHGQLTRLRLCANPGCDNLAGDSEAMLPLKACASCGAVWYCRRECQTAHWRAGHKTECGAMRVTQQARRPAGS